jgi:hypothetical protein
MTNVNCQKIETLKKPEPRKKKKKPWVNPDFSGKPVKVTRSLAG